MSKNITLKDCDAERAKMLIAEITKVRCWVTGFMAGRSTGNLDVGIPGGDSLRQIQIILKDSIGQKS